MAITRKRYLMTDKNGRVIETPGEMLWRVAQHMAKLDKSAAEEFYQLMVAKKFVCSGKAMFEAGNPGGSGQLAACFVLPIEDSIDAIFKTLGQAGRLVITICHDNIPKTGCLIDQIKLTSNFSAGHNRHIVRDYICFACL